MKALKSSFFKCLFLLFLTIGFNNCVAKKKAIKESEKIIVKSDKEKIDEKNILYLVDGKEVASSYIKSISPNDIFSVTVIKGEKDVAKYTDKKYDGVIIIKMKK